MGAQAIQFDITHRDATSGARIGVVHTQHGSFETPAFMPVGSRAAVKGILPGVLRATGSQIILNNAYHLMLRPGSELIAQLGGVHRFMQWPGPILTDSGGYQAFSMSDINSFDDDGVTFKSIIDGAQVRLTPEESIRVQNNLGADIIMAFDDCPPAASQHGQSRHEPGGTLHASRLRTAVERTARWLERCVLAHERPQDQALFGIVQGGTDPDLRRRSVEQVCSIDLAGYAIGGVAVGEGPEEILRVVEFTAPLLPEDRPRYLMGVGYERDLVASVRAGCDMFDCVLPTRNGRNGMAFTRSGRLHLRNARFREDSRPIDENCDCPVCRVGGGWERPPSLGEASEERHSECGGTPKQEAAGGRDGSHFSRAYLRHLFLSGEMLGPILLSVHNIRHFQRLMLDIRRAARENDWLALEQSWPVIRDAGVLSGSSLAGDQRPAADA